MTSKLMAFVKKNLKISVLVLIILISLGVGVRSGWSAFEWEVPLPPAPGGVTLDATSIDTLFNYLYNFGLGLGGFFAFIRLILAGIKWGAEGAGIPQRAAAINDIKNTLFGLLLLLFSWVILNTVNPQILNLNLKVSQATPQQTETRQGLAGVFDSLTNSPQRRSLDEIFRQISKEYLIQVKPSIVRPLSLGNPQLEPVKLCPPPSTADAVCAIDCTEANDPCDFYRAKCTGKTPKGWDPECPLPADPKCRGGNGTILPVCTLVWDWEPDFKNHNCNYDASGLPEPERGGGGYGAPDDYRTYLVEAANFFGIPPKILAAIMITESEGLLFDDFEGISPDYVQKAAAPGGYIGLANVQDPEANDHNWCIPNKYGALGPTGLTIKSCTITGLPKERCTWDYYCKFRNAANQIRHNWNYAPNPSNILDAFAMTAKRFRFLMDDGEGGEFEGMANDYLGYHHTFSPCPTEDELLKWDPPTINPIIFYILGHWQYGDCLSVSSLQNPTTFPRLTNPKEVPIDTSPEKYKAWAEKNAEKIMKVREAFAGYLISNGFFPAGQPIEDTIDEPTYCDFIWWYYENH